MPRSDRKFQVPPLKRHIGDTRIDPVADAPAPPVGPGNSFSFFFLVKPAPVVLAPLPAHRAAFFAAPPA